MRLSGVIGLLILLATSAVAATQTTFTGPFTQTFPTTTTGTVSCSNPTATTLNCTLSAPLQKNAAATLGPMTSGSPQGGGGGVAPVVTAMPCAISSPITNATNVIRTQGAGACGYSATCSGGACTGSNVITGWAITAQSCASCYSITSSAILQGGTNAANVATETDTVTVRATNSTGTSPGVMQTITAYADGTPGSPVGGSFQNANFFTTAPQNGQTYTVRPPWNVAGVEYTVGIPAGTTLKNPTTGCTSGGTGCTNLPACAEYFNDPGNPAINIIGSGNCTLDGFDFSVNNPAQGGGGIIIEDDSSTAGHTLTISNSKFVNGTFSNTKGQVVYNAGAVNPNFVFTNNDINMAAQTFNGSGNLPVGMFLSNHGTGTTTWRYNRFANFDPRNGPGSTITAQYNYFECQSFASDGIHGEWILMYGGAPYTAPTFTWEYNTMLEPAACGNGSTAPVYQSTGAGANATSITWTTSNIDHNVSVINLFTFTGYISSSTMTVTVLNNVGGYDLLAAPCCQVASIIGGVITNLHASISSQNSGTPGQAGVYTLSANVGTVGSAGSPVTLGWYPSSVPFVEMNYNNYGTLNDNNNYIDCSGVFSSGACHAVNANSVNSGPSPWNSSNNFNLVTGASVGQ